MESNNSKYYEISNPYLSYALSFLGFRFYKFNNSKTTNQMTYGFEDTKEFREVLSLLTQLKYKYNKNI